MENTQTRSRRRGTDLETALLAAAWDQLLESGPAGFSLEAVAERAQTSKPVLYRRWTNARAMLAATLAWAGQRDALAIPDTGNLREDLLGLLRTANRQPERFLLLLKVAAMGLMQGVEFSPADLRHDYLSASPLGVDILFDRAVERGEIAQNVLTPRLRSVAFDLFRAQLMLTLAPLADTELAAIVDEVVIPLITRAALQHS